MAHGKENYLDILMYGKCYERYYTRLKRISHQAILNKCIHLGITEEEQYEALNKGYEMKFDLLDGINEFKKTKVLQQIILYLHLIS